MNRERVIQVGQKAAVPATSQAEEKRWSNRKTGRTPGLIYPGGVAASIPCMVADQSVTGARLVMQPGWVNPFRGVSSIGEKITVAMRMDRMEVDCEIVRIEENEMGVRFTSVIRPIARRM